MIYIYVGLTRAIPDISGAASLPLSFDMTCPGSLMSSFNSFNTNIDRTAKVIAHEIGHNHGMKHVSSVGRSIEDSRTHIRTLDENGSFHSSGSSSSANKHNKNEVFINLFSISGIKKSLTNSNNQEWSINSIIPIREKSLSNFSFKTSPYDLYRIELRHQDEQTQSQSFHLTEMSHTDTQAFNILIKDLGSPIAQMTIYDISDSILFSKFLIPFSGASGESGVRIIKINSSTWQLNPLEIKKERMLILIKSDGNRKFLSNDDGSRALTFSAQAGEILMLIYPQTGRKPKIIITLRFY